MSKPGLGANLPPDDSNNTDGEDYYTPLQSARPFSAGIKRRRITFVPASTQSADFHQRPPPPPNPSDIPSKYLSIVIKPDDTASPTPHPESETPTFVTCPICNTAVPKGTSRSTHESSITHQLALEHSFPPSHLDRQRKGLKYLSTYGWDPNSRVGLGAQGREGIRVPVKAVEKRDTAGLGLFSDQRDENGESMLKRKGRVRVVEEEVPKMNAKQVRKSEDDKKKRAERLRGTFYGEDLSQYLGSDG